MPDPPRATQPCGATQIQHASNETVGVAQILSCNPEIRRPLAGFSGACSWWGVVTPGVDGSLLRAIFSQSPSPWAVLLRVQISPLARLATTAMCSGLVLAKAIAVMFMRASPVAGPINGPGTPKFTLEGAHDS